MMGKKHLRNLCYYNFKVSFTRNKRRHKCLEVSSRVRIEFTFEVSIFSMKIRQQIQ